MSLRLFPELVRAVNESGKWPNDNLVIGFADKDEELSSHCESCESNLLNNSSDGCPNRLVGPRTPTGVVLSNPTNRCFLLSVFTNQQTKCTILCLHISLS